MQAIFNEQSLLGIESQTQEAITNMIATLVKVCQQLQTMDSTFKMRINENFWIAPILEDIDSDIKIFLYAITDSPYLPDEEIDTNNDKFFDESLTSAIMCVDEDSGIRVAYAFSPNPVPLVSVANGEWENIDTIEVKSELRNPIFVLNIATEKQLFDVHFEAIATQHLALNTAKPNSLNVEKILPNKEITNLYIDYQALYQNERGRRTLKSNTPIKVIQDIGSLVAKLNGWQKHDNYSRINRRKVFEHVESHTIFIAIDTEKGDFEVHNSNNSSNHLGAISFDGEKVEPPKNHILRFR